MAVFQESARPPVEDDRSYMDWPAVFAGAVADGVVDGTFGPYFTVRGEIGDGKIVWNNGAVWWKM